MDFKDLNVSPFSTIEADSNMGVSIFLTTKSFCKSLKKNLVLIFQFTIIFLLIVIIYLNAKGQLVNSPINGKISESLTLHKNCSRHFHTCEDIMCGGHNSSGIYEIVAWRPLNIYCDQATDGGGWTVIQRRVVSIGRPENFYRKLSDYVSGFGNLNQSFWLGLSMISELSAGSNMELQIDLEDWQGERRFAHYKHFRVTGVNENYKLIVDGYSGNAGDSLSYHNNCKFSTEDSDNDNRNDNCAKVYKGAWWYNKCYESNLNGIFNGTSHQGITWNSWHQDYSLKRTEMKMRKRNFKCE